MSSASSKWCSLLALLWLTTTGCREVPLKNDPDAVTAPSFGLNSVPRQWEPDLEEGDTSERGSLKIAAEFEELDENRDPPEEAGPPDSAGADAPADSSAGGGRSSRKSPAKPSKSKPGKSQSGKALPEVDKAAQQALDDDFGPGD